eukprot:1162145-Pelagomonas_calceolata.AAC.2
MSSNRRHQHGLIHGHSTDDFDAAEQGCRREGLLLKPIIKKLTHSPGSSSVVLKLTLLQTNANDPCSHFAFNSRNQQSRLQIKEGHGVPPHVPAS